MREARIAATTRSIAALMTVPVVDAFEEVEVEHQHRDLLIGAMRALQFRPQSFEAVRARRAARYRVNRAQLAELLDGVRRLQPVGQERREHGERPL